MSKIVEGLFYTNTHEWIKVEDGFAFIGITDYAQESLGEIVFIELPEEDDSLEKGGELGAIESVKAASDILSPITGTVIEANANLEDEPELLNTDAFANWIVKVELSDESELKTLLNAEQYKEICE